MRENPRTTNTTSASHDCSETQLLNALVFEQAMRTASSAEQVAALIDVEPLTREAYIALGRLLTAVPVNLTVGTPLVALCSGASIISNWRTHCPVHKGSLASTLIFFEQLHGPISFLGAPNGMSSGSTMEPWASCTNALEALHLHSDRADSELRD